MRKQHGSNKDLSCTRRSDRLFLSRVSLEAQRLAASLSFVKDTDPDASKEEEIRTCGIRPHFLPLSSAAPRVQRVIRVRDTAVHSYIKDMLSQTSIQSLKRV
jgi:hypothetical protein